MKRHFSQRVAGTKRSAIRELLKLTERPEIISFAGGLPDPETFPAAELAEIAADELRKNSRNVLQYSTTEGSRMFRRAMIDWLEPQGLSLSLGQILTTSSSQQGLDLLAKTFIDPGDVVFCGLPTYLGAIQAFSLLQAEKKGIPLEEDGMNLDILQEEIEEAKASGKVLKAIYVIPDFQNPTGITMSLEKRKRLLEIACREDLLVFEDNPYGQLRFSGKPLPFIRSFDKDGRVIMLITMSKILSAGMRLAVIIANEDLMEMIVRVKQATDLCTSKLIQHLAARYFLDYDMNAHLSVLRERYRSKCKAMLAALEKYMPAEVGIHWTRPNGGLFLWLTLPPEIDTEEMLARAIENKVAYVIGKAFYVDGSGKSTMRLSFSVNKEEEIDEGIRRLSYVVKQELTARKTARVAVK
jgi:2-aminoadipate transaminase